MAREWQEAIGLALEDSFGQYKAPTIWMPGQAKLKTSTGIREIKDRPTGNWDETRVTVGPTKVDGSLTLEVAPGREAIIQQMLARRLTGDYAYQTMNSFTVVQVIGDYQNPTEMFVNTGVCVNKGTFNCASGEDLIFNADVIGRARTRSNIPLLPNWSTTPPAPYVF